MAALPPSPAHQIGAMLRQRFPKAPLIRVACKWTKRPKLACEVEVVLPSMRQYGCEAIYLVPDGKHWRITGIRRGAFYCPVVKSSGHPPVA